MDGTTRPPRRRERKGEWIQDRGIGMPVDPMKWFAFGRPRDHGAAALRRTRVPLPGFTLVWGCDGCTNYLLRICDILSGN